MTTPPAPSWKCSTCGDWMRWNPGVDALVCPSCRTARPAAPPDRGGDVVPHRVEVDGFPPDSPIEPTELTCIGCGAAVHLELAVISGSCSYCHAPFVALEHRGPPYPDGVVPATLDFVKVESAMAAWAASRWLAPRAFRHGARPTLALTYRALWVIGAGTDSEFSGERGEPGGGQGRRRLAGIDPNAYQEGLATWYPVEGTVQLAFPGVVVMANGFGRPELSWQLDAAVPYRDAYLVGSTAHAPVTLWTDALNIAQEEMKEKITEAACAEIGGPLQRVVSLSTSYSELTYRYLLAPTWSGSYEWRGRAVPVEVNAETGQISGRYPRSKVQVALLVVALVAAVTAAVLAAVL